VLHKETYNSDTKENGRGTNRNLALSQLMKEFGTPLCPPSPFHYKGDVWPGDGCALVRALWLKILMDGEKAKKVKKYR